MKEVKAPKKPIISYYVIILAVMLIFNFFVMPGIAKSRIKNARYDEFMDMTLNKEIGKVEVQQNQILFTDTEEKNIYKTGIIYDPDMINRLYDSGAKFSSDIVEEEAVDDIMKPKSVKQMGNITPSNDRQAPMTYNQFPQYMDSSNSMMMMQGIQGGMQNMFMGY